MDYYRTLEISLEKAGVTGSSGTALYYRTCADYKEVSVYTVLTISDESDTRTTLGTHTEDSSEELKQDSPRKFTLDEDALQANRLILDFDIEYKRDSAADQLFKVQVPLLELLRSSGVRYTRKVSATRQFYETPLNIYSTSGTLKFSYRFGQLMRKHVTSYPVGPNHRPIAPSAQCHKIGSNNFVVGFLAGLLVSAIVGVLVSYLNFNIFGAL